MMKIFPVLAEIVPQNALFLECSSNPLGMMVAVCLFLILICLGVAIDIALVLFFIKRPENPSRWGDGISPYALPDRTVFFVSALVITMYLGSSFAYYVFFPDVKELEPSVLLFQGFFFNVPASLILAGLFIYHRKRGSEARGWSWRRIPVLVGLSGVLYLATVPILWFYSLLYQTFLYQLGCDIYLQEVAQIFLAPVPILERIAMYSVAIVLAPAVEELFFRGLLFPWAVRRVGFWPATVGVSFVFASIHLHLPSFLPLFLLSGLFCAAYARTRSILVPIGMHACFNGISLLVLRLTG